MAGAFRTTGIPRWAGALVMALAAVVMAATVAVVATPAPVAAAGRSAVAGSLVGGRSEPIYSYPNAIREQISVETTVDSDADGERDRVTVDLVRPREAAAAGVKVPVIMEASPYYECCGRGNEDQKKTYGPDGTVTGMPLFYDNYFVPRGYAFAAVDLTGSNRSRGCPDVGGPAEVLGARAVVDWLNGRARGFRPDGVPAKADWTTGTTGMIGKSWDGTIANGVAATGVEGLATIVPIGGISSWYDYSRYDGVIRESGHAPRLAGLVNGRKAGVCDAMIAAMKKASDDETGNYNTFWAARNHLPDARKVRASVFAVHGVNDVNVTTRQLGRWWDRLAAAGVPRKLWLAQPGHVDPFDFRRSAWVDTLHAWFDRWLLGAPERASSRTGASIERQSGQWVDEARWPAVTGPAVGLRLGNGSGSGAGTIGGRPAPGIRTFTEDPKLTEAKAVAAPNEPRNGRLAFLTGKLRRDLRLSGEATATLRVKVDKPTTTLTTRLVDYGGQRRVDYQSAGNGIHDLKTKSCWGPSTTADSSCYLDTAEDFITSDVAVLTRGWKDAAHYRSLSQRTPLRPGRWYTITVAFQPYDAVIGAGHTLGLVLTGTEPGMPTTSGATVQLDVPHSRLNLPIAGAGPLPNISVPPGLGDVAPDDAPLPPPEKLRRDFH